MDRTDVAKDFWYPVTMMEDLDAGPKAVTLLNERLVVFRTEEGVASLRDLCCHRGTPLSMGRISEAGTIVCSYHGWEYNTDGRCVRIPQRSPELRIPSKAQVDSFLTEVRYGAVWVCLREPRSALPEYPEYADPGYRTIFSGSYTWKAGAARMMENFLDPAHLAFVHPGLLGDPDRPEFSMTPIRASEDELTFAAENDVPAPNEGEWVREMVDYRYRLPYYLWVTRDSRGVSKAFAYAEQPGEHQRFVLFTAIQPITPKESRRYTWFARNYALDEREDDRFQKFLETLREQDRVIVESQRPEELPLDLTAEMQVKGVDDPGLAFRRLLADRGLIESALAAE